MKKHNTQCKYHADHTANMQIARRGHAREFIDLHTHTTASDGSFPAGKLVREAAVKGLSAIAITDHDSVAGVEEGIEEGKNHCIEVVPGIEMTARYNSEMHLLGLYIDHSNNQLTNYLQKLSVLRMRLLVKAFSLLSSRGISITPAEVMVTQSTLSLSSLADHLLIKGLVTTRMDIDAIYGHVWEEWQNNLLTPLECIAFIHESNGFAFLAHPKRLDNDDAQILKTIKLLREYGMDGIECIHAEHTPADRKKYMCWAKQLGLLCTGGSDFHGAKKSGLEIGTGYGDLEVPYSFLESIKDKQLKE
ncbi:MAG: PHP domain-containing protein [Chitinispirillaceae bacterium]|nr:PHP domain-containing protein [Chitinispirillaceae bacterium]